MSPPCDEGKPRELRVHFIGWKARFDESVRVATGRLRPLEPPRDCEAPLPWSGPAVKLKLGPPGGPATELEPTAVYVKIEAPPEWPEGAYVEEEEQVTLTLTLAITLTLSPTLSLTRRSSQALTRSHASRRRRRTRWPRGQMA